MLLLQLTGLSGAGKTTVSQLVKEQLLLSGISVEVLDGDQLRKTSNRDLGFSKTDRQENIRRLAKLANSFTGKYEVVIIAAINPFQEVREELEKSHNAKTVWIDCPIEKLIKRDPKGLYRRALLNNDDPEKIFNFTGIDDVYEPPIHPHLIINTEIETVEQSTEKLMHFIKGCLNGQSSSL